jgi:hypothetical protein
MFEVVLTMRPDFVEQVLARCATEAEAQAIAQRVSADRPAEVLRVWVRRARKVQTRESENP